MQIRITKKDIEAVYEAADFVSTNTDGAVEDRVYFDELNRRLHRVWTYLKRRAEKRK